MEGSHAPSLAPSFDASHRVARPRSPVCSGRVRYACTPSRLGRPRSRRLGKLEREHHDGPVEWAGGDAGRRGDTLVSRPVPAVYTHGDLHGSHPRWLLLVTGDTGRGHGDGGIARGLRQFHLAVRFRIWPVLALRFTAERLGADGPFAPTLHGHLGCGTDSHASGHSPAPDIGRVSGCTF